jgi:hypothetical protein
MGWDGPGFRCKLFAKRTNISGKDDLCSKADAFRTVTSNLFSYDGLEKNKEMLEGL